MTLQILANLSDAAPFESHRPQLSRVCALLSMLHEPETPIVPKAPDNSASRMFQGRPVLAATLARLKKFRRVQQSTVLCWDDQFSAAGSIAADMGNEARSIGPRQPGPWLNAVIAARKWADGWRGGLLSTCEFDRGFDAAAARDFGRGAEADAVLLIDPAAAFVDETLLDSILSQADMTPSLDLFFAPAAPGLCGALMRLELLEKLASVPPNLAHAGRYLHYLPETPGADPISGEGCAAIPTPLARTAHRFSIDSARQTSRLERAAEILRDRGESAAEVSAERLLDAVNQLPIYDEMPREIVLEINTQRASKPIFSPAGRLGISRPDMTPSLAAQLLKEISAADDMRLTISGVGDPILSEHFLAIANLAQTGGVHAVRVETDLLSCDRAKIAAIAAAPIDVISVYLPAITPGTYAAVMGVDAMLEAVSNLRELLLQRHLRQSGTPIVVPVFVKCRQNLGEMEAWYDQWLRAVGSATIVGPSDFAAQIADTAVADMSPARRITCRRLDRRMTILSDGSIVACEQDVLGRRILGKVGEDRITDIWTGACGSLRREHAAGHWNAHPLCQACREWHR